MAVDQTAWSQVDCGTCLCVMQVGQGEIGFITNYSNSRIEELAGNIIYVTSWLHEVSASPRALV